MKPRIPRISPKAYWLAGLAVIAVAGFIFRNAWWPSIQGWVQGIVSANRATTADEHGHEHEDEDSHEHEGHSHEHSDATSLELSQQARLNLGLTPDQLRPVQLEEFARSITIPAIVAERPGRTHIEVSAPLTGVVTAVHVVPGSAVEPGDLLFEMRLTHEDLVQAQIDFLKSLSELDVEEKEIARLQPLVDKGALAATVIRDREYARDKLEALLSAQREALRLHGLSEAQVNGIAEERRLLREVRVYVPSGDMTGGDELQLTRELADVAHYDEESRPSPPIVLQELRVHKGQALDAGMTMCVLADYSELYIEGAAFEQDALALAAMMGKGWTVEAVFEEPGHASWSVPGLEIAYLANEVDIESRTLHFYVRLPNEILRDAAGSGTSRFVSWRYRPGQRLQLRVPVEKWEQQIVLPVDAVATSGAEHFVYVQNGGHFDQVPVTVVYRDQFSVVIANNGAVFPGDVVARRGAHQMLMAIKNKAGGGIDPHAGHNH
jgi:multidrug efflux pump subunit AcrA (membrane-fusion protein)